MGCYPPLEKIVSKALGKCNGRDRWKKERLDYALAYPPTEIHYMRPVARTVTFASNNSVYVIPPSPPPPTQPQPQPQPQEQEQEQQKQSPPEPPQQPQTPPQQHEPEQHPDEPQPQPQPEQPAAEAEPPAPTQDAPPPAQPEPKRKPPKGPKRGKKKHSGRVRFGPEPPPPQQQEEEEQPQEEEHDDAQGPAGDSWDAPGKQGPRGAAAAAPPPPAQEQGRGYLLRYTPSPLPRWEATPRRHEYFSGEYRSYYPTPVREGIYRIATDANRLTTIFSEENPNACTIV
ncbi:unnamed protein product [Urochloa humidicola]